MVKNTKKSSRKSFRLSSLDLVGGEFSFEFPTFSRKFKTKLGTCINMVMGIICILATLLIGSKYFDTSSPSVTFSNQKGPEIIHNLAKEFVLPPVAVYMEGAPLTADISKFVSLRVDSLAHGFDREANQQRLFYIVITNLVDCKELNDPYYNKILSEIDDGNKFKNILKCPDFKGNYSLAEVIDGTKNLLFKQVILGVFPCSLVDSSECLPSDSISKLRVVVAHTKKSVVPSNYTHPYKISVEMEEIAINPLRHRSRQSLSKMTKIVDLRNEIFGEKERDRFVSTKVMVDDDILRIGAPTTCTPLGGNRFGPSCQGYISFLFQGGTEAIQVKRLYNSPTQIIGEIGGVFKVALMFGMVYMIYNRIMKRLFITNNVFHARIEDDVNERISQFRRKAQGEAGGIKESGRAGRSKVVPKKLTGRGSGGLHSTVVKRECFRSATSISNLMKTENILDLFENLTLNEFSQKLLPQAILIKRYFMRSSALREQYHASMKRFKNRFRREQAKKHSKEEFGEYEEEKELEPELKNHKATPLGMNFSSKIPSQADVIKDQLRSYIESQLNGNPWSDRPRSKIETKNLPKVVQNPPDPEIQFKIPKAKNFEDQKIRAQKSRGESESEQQNLESLSSQLSSRSQRSLFRNSNLLRTPTSQKSSFNRSRISSFGQKILVKNYLKASRLSKDNNSKQN